jgi:hypothetical protein
MKRYITGIIAMVIAISAVAFTKENKKYDTQFFTYTGTDYKEASVQTPGNWTHVSSHDPLCNGTNVRACEIEVDPMFVNPDNSLKPLNILTNSSSTDVYYVTGGDIISKHNKN